MEAPSIRARLRAWNQRLKHHIHGYMVIVAVVVGVLAGLAAVGFRALIDLLQQVFWSGEMLSVAWLQGLPWYHVVLAPAVGGLLVGLLVHYGAREAKGHGVPEVMEAVALKGGRIRPRVVAVKALASGLCIASGGSVGREGPIVQIGAALGSSIGQWLRLNTRRLRTIAGCGAAAGIAATFNAPIAGLLFALEVLLRDLRFTQVAPIVVASVLATAVSRELLEDTPAFIIPNYELVTPLELPAYAVLGLLAALVAVVFIRVLYRAEDSFERLRIHPALLAALGGAGVGAFALQFPEVLGNGYEAIEHALRDAPVWTWLALLLLAKIVGVCLTLGTGGSGGVFAPSLFVGAMAGGLVGAAMNALFPGAVGPVGAYALVGMGAVVAATTHAPLTAIIILFELTGDYRIILPLMIACTLATLLSARLQPESIYTMKLARRGTKLHAGRDVDVLRSVRVSDVMRTEVPTLPAGESLHDVLADIAHDDAPFYFVLDDEGGLVGTIGLKDLRPVLADLESCEDLLTAGDVAESRGKPLGHDDTLDTALARMQRTHRQVWPVVREGKLSGCLHLDDILGTYRREIFKRDMAQGMSSAFLSDEPILRTIGNYRVIEVEAPSEFEDQTLADLALRRRGVSVLLVKRTADGVEEVTVPLADTVLKRGDRLLLMGTEEALADLGVELDAG